MNVFVSVHFFSGDCVYYGIFDIPIPALKGYKNYVIVFVNVFAFTSVIFTSPDLKLPSFNFHYCVTCL